MSHIARLASGSQPSRDQDGKDRDAARSGRRAAPAGGSGDRDFGDQYEPRASRTLGTVIAMILMSNIIDRRREYMTSNATLRR